MALLDQNGYKLKSYSILRLSKAVSSKQQLASLPETINNYAATSPSTQVAWQNSLLDIAPPLIRSAA